MPMPPHLNGPGVRGHPEGAGGAGQDGYPAAGKRQAQGQWGGVDPAGDDSAEVDLLNRLVKRCRCNDVEDSLEF